MQTFLSILIVRTLHAGLSYLNVGNQASGMVGPISPGKCSHIQVRVPQGNLRSMHCGTY